MVVIDVLTRPPHHSVHMEQINVYNGIGMMWLLLSMQLWLIHLLTFILSPSLFLLYLVTCTDI